MGNLSALDLNLLRKWSIYREAEHSKNIKTSNGLIESITTNKGSLAYGRDSAWQELTLHNYPGIPVEGSDVGSVTSHHITFYHAGLKDTITVSTNARSSKHSRPSTCHPQLPSDQ